MIIIDFSQIFIASWMAQTKGDPSVIVEIPLVRHVALNMIRAANMKFKHEYGELVIATDSLSWRKKEWPYYKARRSINKGKSLVNWPALTSALGSVGAEFNANLKYRYINVDGAEGDDIIGALVNNAPENESILICSGDEDFIQLHKRSNIRQYAPVQKKFVTTNDHIKSLWDKICTGDDGDDIPNILNPDDCFVLKIKQKPLRKKRIDLWFNPMERTPENGWTDEVQSRWERNKKLIDLTETPKYIVDNIIALYENQANKKSNIFNYFRQNNLREHLANINDF